MDQPNVNPAVADDTTPVVSSEEAAPEATEGEVVVDAEATSTEEATA